MVTSTEKREQGRGVYFGDQSSHGLGSQAVSQQGMEGFLAKTCNWQEKLTEESGLSLQETSSVVGENSVAVF